MMSSPILDHRFVGAEHAVAARDAGIVDQDRDGANLVGDLLRHRDAGGAIGDVERKALRLTAGAPDLLGCFRHRIAVHVEQHHARTLAAIPHGDGAPDARACTGDDGDVIVEEGHGVSLF